MIKEMLSWRINIYWLFTYIIMGSVRMICLNEMEMNRCGKVIEIEADNSIKRRFLDLGIVPGALIERVLVSPFGGISAYFIMGSTIAIRDGDAKGIKVCYEEI